MNIKQAAKAFGAEFRDAFKKVGNNLASGIGLDDKTGEHIIVAYLTTKKLKNILPETYKGFKVKVKVIGVIKAL